MRADEANPIRWGIAGTGAIANQFAAALDKIDDAELVAVASHEPDRATAFAAQHGVPRQHVGYDALAGDEGVDVVYVASTQERHVDDTLLFLDAGRHVLCEKPFALRLVDARRMVEASRAAERFLMEAMWSRFLPSYVRLAELLDEGAIGEPRLLEANFSICVPDDAVAGHRLFDPRRGGGALLDLGVYPVHLADFVFGAPESVAATARLTNDGIDEQTSLLLGHHGGGAALLHTALRTSGTCAARLMGVEGTIELAAFMHCTTRLTITKNGAEPEVLGFAEPSLHHQVREVHHCLREGRVESEVMPHAETLAIMTTLDEALGQIGVVYPALEGS